MYNYSKLAIAIGNEDIRGILQQPVNPETDNDYVRYVQLVEKHIDRDSISFSETITSIPIPSDWWDIDCVRQNIPFLVRTNAMNETYMHSIEYFLMDCVGIALDKNKQFLKKHRNVIRNHPKIKALCELIQYSATFCIFPDLGAIIKNFIPEKELAENYLDICLQRTLLSFNDSSFLSNCAPLKKLLNLKKNKYFIKIMNTPEYFENLTRTDDVVKVLELLHYMGEKERFGEKLLKLTELNEIEEHDPYPLQYGTIQQIKDFGYLNELKTIVSNLGKTQAFYLDLHDNLVFKVLYETFPEEIHALLKDIIINKKIDSEGQEKKLYCFAKMARYDTKEEVKNLISQELEGLPIFDLMEKSDDTFLPMTFLSIFLRLKNEKLTQKCFDLSIVALLKDKYIQQEPEGVLSVLQQKFKDMTSLEELKTKEVFDIGKFLAECDFSEDD